MPKSWNISQVKEIQYKVFSTENIFDPNNDALLEGGSKSNSKRFVVIDSELHQTYISSLVNYFESKQITYKIVPFISKEKNKSMSSFINLFAQLDEFEVDRQHHPLIAIGGGVLTDVAGFVAGCYRRGIPHIKVPTTLMGYVDASVGIKTGINFNNSKNRMGSFQPPKAVILDKTFFKTLSERHIKNGVGEILKIALIKNHRLFNKLESYGSACINTKFQDLHGDEILNSSITNMLEELAPNLYEDNLERLVDFGHTFSAALEMKDEENLLHGEAVAIDIAFSTTLANICSLINKKEVERIFNLIKLLKLPYYHSALTPSLLWQSINERTRHRGGKQRIPLPITIGQGQFVNDISYEQITKAYDLYRQHCEI